MSDQRVAPRKSGNLSITALYTAETWHWGGFSGAELLASREARGVFRITNAVLGLARLLRPRIPSLRHGLAQRHAMLDRLCADHVAAAQGPCQILELGAGLSRRGVAFSGDVNVVYIEVDLPAMVAHKRGLLERTPQGRAVAERENLRLVAGDVSEIDLHGLLDPGRPVFVVAEGLIMYLDPEGQRELWRRVAAVVSKRAGSGFAFDLVPFCEQPRPGVIGRSLELLFKAFTRGRTIAQDARTRTDIVSELLGCGFASAEALEPGQVADAWGLPYADRRTQVVVFRCH